MSGPAVPARKGDVVAYTVNRAYTTVEHKRVAWTVHRLGIAEQCSRDGWVRKVRQAGYGTVVDVDRTPHVRVVAVCPRDTLTPAPDLLELLPGEDLDSFEDVRQVIAPLKR
jgi:hypothetical protein